VEIEFTEPLKAGVGTKASDYNIRQWWYKPTEEYGGPKLDNKELKISAVTLSEDRKRVFLKLSGMKANHVVYIRLNRENLISESDQNLWSTEAWYTMNSIPTDSGLARK
jgi:cytochrome c